MTKPSTNPPDWETRVMSHAGWVRRMIVLRIGDRGTAEDLAQETLAVALQGGERPAPGGQVRAWLGGIARNKALEHLRRAGRRSKLWKQWENDPSSEGPVPSTPLELLVMKERTDLVQEALDALPAEEATLLRYKYLRGLSYAEIGDLAGLSHHEVANRLKAARGHLRVILCRASGRGDEPLSDNRKP